MAQTWRQKVPPLVPLISAVLGVIALIFSFMYMFGVVGLQTDTVSHIMDLCKSLPGRNIDCELLMEETAAGVIGCLFSIIQIALSVWIFLKKSILRLWKVWMLSSIILFIFMLTTGCLVFHAFDSYNYCIRLGIPTRGSTRAAVEVCSPLVANSAGRPVACHRHYGCYQFGVGFGNFVALFYGLLTFFNSLFLLASGIMMYLIAKNVDIPVQSITASLVDNSQPAKVDSRTASRAPSKVTQKASTKPSSSSMKK